MTAAWDNLLVYFVSWSFRNAILSNNNVIICYWFPVFFAVVLRILFLNDLTSWRNLVLNLLSLSKKSILNWWNCSVISSFSVSFSWKRSVSSDIHSRFLNVLIITNSFSNQSKNYVSVKTPEDNSNSMDSFTKLYTFSLPHFFCFSSACVLMK